MAPAQLSIALLVLAKFCDVALGAEQLDTKASKWVQSGAVGKSKTITLRFWVKLTHTHDLKDILSRVSNPKSPEYGHYMSKAQVDALTKPATEDISAVKAALKGYDTHSQNADAVISADVPVSFAQQLLGGEFVYLCHPSVDGTSERVCEIRNPTAKVPSRLRQACDIISPIDDPLPPIRPFPGPIIEPIHPSRSFLVTNLETSKKNEPAAGCCFSLGYGGPMMRPCCLKANSVSDVSSCEVDDNVGGSASYSLGECPASAAAAERIIEKQKLDKPTKEVLKQADEFQANLMQSQLSTAGCCFSLGYGSMMKPCCLETQRVADVSSCKRESRMGGASSYSLGNCPVDADDAAKIVAAQLKVPAHAGTHPTSMTEKQPHAARGCCYSFGTGALSKPCCLEARSVHDVGACKVQPYSYPSGYSWLGGASGYSYGACPADAQEAADMFAAQSGESDKNGKGESASGGSTTLIVVFLVGCGGVLAGLFVAAKRRPDWRTTPFLHDNGAE